MQRTPSSRLSGAARPSHRQSGEFRGRHSFGANGDNGAGVAQISAPISNGQVRSNGMMGGSQHFDLARSPPTTTNKSNHNLSLPYFLLSSDSFHVEQTPNTFPANSSNKAHVKPDKHAPSFIRPMRLLTRLHVNISQRFVEIKRSPWADRINTENIIRAIASLVQNALSHIYFQTAEESTGRMVTWE